MVEISSLIENCSNSPDLATEHGLSLYIRHNNRNFLLDTGATTKFIDNAMKIGIDLASLDGIIISHNHSDHIGGLSALLESNLHVKVYIKSSAQSEFFYKIAFIKKYIGEEKGLFSKYADRFIFIDDDWDITDTLHLCSDMIHDKAYVCKDTALLEKKGGQFIPDEFNHELFVVIEEKEKLILLSSCSHSGIVNIVNSVKQKFPDKPISHIIAGFHMQGFGIHPLNCSKKYVQDVAQILKKSCDGTIHTCHCTGKTAFHLMEKTLGNQIAYLSTGEKILIQ